MKEFDCDTSFDMLDVVLGAKFYVGNFIQNSIDGSNIKYSELSAEPFILENSGLTKQINEYSEFLSPLKLSDRKNIQ